MPKLDAPSDSKPAAAAPANAGIRGFKKIAPRVQAESPPFIVEGLAGPLGTAVSARTGDLFITNSDLDSLAVVSPGDVSPNGVSYRTWKDPSAKYTAAVAVGMEGHVVVVNQGSDSVSVFAPDGTLQETITHHQLKKPNCVAIAPATGDAFITNAEWSNLVRIPAARIVSGQGDLAVIEDRRMGWTTGIAISPKTGDAFLSTGGDPGNHWAGAGLLRIPASRIDGGSEEITGWNDPRMFYRCGGVAVARNGDVFVTNATSDDVAAWTVGAVTRVPAALAGGGVDIAGLDLIRSATLNNPLAGRVDIAASPFTGSVYVVNKQTSTIVRIPYARAMGGDGTPEVFSDGVALNGPHGLVLSPITGDLYVTQPRPGSLVRLDIGISVTGAGEGQFYTVPPAVTSVVLHTQGGSNVDGTGLDLKTTLDVAAGHEFYLINQYNAAYIFSRSTPKNPWEPLLVGGGAGTGTSVQTVGVPRSDGNGTIYAGNGGFNGGGGAGWGGGAGVGAGAAYWWGVALAGSGYKGGDSVAYEGKGGVEGAAGAAVGGTAAALGGEGTVTLAMDEAAVAFAVTGGNSHFTGYLRGGAGYCGGGNAFPGADDPYPDQSGAGSGYAAAGLDDVTATASPAETSSSNGNNIPISELIPSLAPRASSTEQSG